ncbi:hypothetical protein M139_1778 [Bacteroides fragilis str. S23L24]|nr:hypothetical protein M139_1778 [Bacteroides fragilis str. S23L24]
MCIYPAQASISSLIHEFSSRVTPKSIGSNFFILVSYSSLSDKKEISTGADFPSAPDYIKKRF